jgi:hypothetical protein
MHFWLGIEILNQNTKYVFFLSLHTMNFMLISDMKKYFLKVHQKNIPKNFAGALFLKYFFRSEIIALRRDFLSSYDTKTRNPQYKDLTQK